MVVSDTNFTSISLLPFLYNHREPNSLALFLALDLDINNNKPISFVCVCVCVCVSSAVWLMRTIGWANQNAVSLHKAHPPSAWLAWPEAPPPSPPHSAPVSTGPQKKPLDKPARSYSLLADTKQKAVRFTLEVRTKREAVTGWLKP